MIRRIAALGPEFLSVVSWKPDPVPGRDGAGTALSAAETQVDEASNRVAP